MSAVAVEATSVLALKVAQALIAVFTSIVVSRVLGPDGRGVYYVPVLVASTTMALCHLGLDQANVYLFGSRRIGWVRLVGQSGAVAIGAGTLGGAGVLIFYALNPGFFEGVAPWAVLLCAATIPFGVHTILATGLLIVRGRTRTPLAVTTGGAALTLTALGAFALASGLTPSLAYAVTGAVTILTAAYLASRLGAVGELIGWDRGLLRQSMSHALVLHAGMVLLYLHLRVDMFVVKSVVGTEALGQYSLTVSLAEAFMLVTDSLATVLLSRQLSGGLREAANSALAGARAVALFGVVALLGWGALGSPAIRLAFGSEFLPAFQPLMLLLPGIVLLGMQRMCGGTVLMAGRPWTLTSLQSLAFALNLGLNLWWVPRFGLSGAALASTLSYAVLAAAVLAWTIRLAEVRPTAVIPGPGDLNRLWTELRFRRHPKPIEYGR